MSGLVMLLETVPHIASARTLLVKKVANLRVLRNDKIQSLTSDYIMTYRNQTARCVWLSLLKIGDRPLARFLHSARSYVSRPS